MLSNHNKVLFLEHWSEGHSFLVALLGPQMATAAQDIHLGFNQIKKRRLFDHQFLLPPLPAWFRLYRSHRKPIHFLRVLFHEFFPSGPEVAEFTESFLNDLRLRGHSKNLASPTPPTPEDITAAQQLLQQILAASFEDLRNDFSNKQTSPAHREVFEGFLRDMDLESSFFLLVHVPCWLLYRTSPSLLYRKARQGNIDALKKLLHLDALMFHDPLIGREINRLRYQGRTTVYKTLLEAPLKPMKVKIDRKRMKYSVAGFISGIAHLIKKPLTERDIHDLFDAVAKDATNDPHAVDLDLIVSPQTFAKAIYRERNFWINALKSDKKI